MKAKKRDPKAGLPPPLRALILEDNPREAKLTASVLEDVGGGVQFEVLNTLELFRERLEKAEYDVIIAEFNLGNWTALDALKILKHSGKDIPVIVLTGTLGDEAAVDCIKQGAADLVQKDRPARLPAAVERALEERRLRTENDRAFETISRLSTIVESSDDAIVGKTMEGIITSWNKGAEKLYGYSSAEVLGQPISVLAPPDRIGEVAQRLARLRRGERFEQVELVRIRKDGSLVNVSLSLFPLINARGEVTGMASIARDITSRKRTEEALREGEEKYRSLVSNIPDVAWTIDAGLRFRFISQNIERVSGFSPEEIYQQGAQIYLDSIHPDDVHKVKDSFRALFDEGRPFDLECRARRKDGKWIWVHDRALAPYEINGIRCADGLLSDITEHKLAEIENARLATIVSTSDDAIFSITREGIIATWNAAAERMYGYTAEEIKGKHYSIIIPAARRGVLAANQEKLLRGEALVHYEHEHERKDGSRLQVLLTLSPIKDATGLVTGVSVIARDITARKRAEGALHKSDAILNAVSYAAEQLLSGSNWEENIQSVLERLGQSMAVSRAYIFENHHGPAGESLFSQRYEWAAPGIPAQINNPELQSLSLRNNYLAAWEEELSQGKVSQGVIADLPERARRHLERQGIKSIIAVPIFVGEAWWGFIGFDECLCVRQWSSAEVEALRAAARTLGTALQHKRADETLRKANEMVRAVVEASPMAITVLDDDDKVLLYSPASERMFGWRAEEVLGGPLPYIRNEARESHKAVLKQAMEGASLSNVELRRQRKDGTWVDFLLSTAPFFDAQGKAVAYVGVMNDITERRRAEKAVIESEERYRSLFQNVPVGIYRTTPDGRILTANLALVRMLGYSSLEELAARDLNAGGFEPEYARSQFMEMMEKRGEVTGLEAEWRKKDGEVVHVRENARAGRDDSGKILYYEGTAEDITERKRTERNLEERTAFLNALIQKSPLAIVVVDSEECVQMCNPTFERLFQYRQEEVVGAPLNALLAPPGLETEADNYSRRSAKGESVTGVTRRRRKDGTLVDVELHGVPLIADGRYAGTYGLYQDITERMKAESEHVRLVTAIEQSAEGVMVTNTNGDIEYVNPAFTRMTGYSREEVLGVNPRILRSEKQDPVFYQHLWETILRGEVWHGELINRRKDGKLYTEESTITPVRDANGEVTHFIATKQDVTERKTLEAQLQQASKMEGIGRLAGGVAHDFNNLLTIINGYSELVLERLNSSDPLRVHLEEIEKAGNRAASLTRQLLAFSRQQVLAPRVLDLNTLVADVEKMLRRLIGEDIALAMARAPGLGQVKADPGQIEQILMNLAVNARDAMPQGGRLTIETANAELDRTYTEGHVTVSPGHYVMLAVNDNGIGMDAETRAKIFEPFFTTKEKGKGTGLGLATVYGIVKQSNGHITVYSELGRGTTFKIYLPRIDEPPELRQTSKAHGRLEVGSETILLVEDEEGLRALAASILRDRGYKVLESTSPEDALQIGERQNEPIDLLLTDVVMPRMSGRNIAEYLAVLHPSMRVLYMSGYTDDSVVRNGVLETGTAFLQKPFTPTTLAHKVRELLDAGRKEIS